MTIDLVPSVPFCTNIKIIGVGGAGGNAINTMIQNGIDGVEFIAANTDIQDLEKSLASYKLQLGKKCTKGLGTGANPDNGKNAAEESIDEIEQLLHNTDMVFIAAGMGGGTGTGAAPVIANKAREMNILTLGIVTLPFKFEGRVRAENAVNGLIALENSVDTLIVIPNDKINDIYSKLSFVDAFNKCNDILSDAAKAVSDVINRSGYMNVDFADVKNVMTNKGYALMGSGEAEGNDRAINASKAAISNPLLSDITLDGCQGLLINVTAGYDFIMQEFDDIATVVTNQTGQGANIIVGLILDPALQNKVRVTIIATGVNYTFSESIPNTKPSFTNPFSNQLSNQSVQKNINNLSQNYSAPVNTPINTNNQNMSQPLNTQNKGTLSYQDSMDRIKTQNYEKESVVSHVPLNQEKPSSKISTFMSNSNEPPAFLKKMLD